MSELILPHGGELVQLTVLEDLSEQSANLPQIPIDAFHIRDVELLATGAYSPLTGFLGRKDYLSVLKEMRLGNGLIFSLPITLPVPTEMKDILLTHEEVALIDKDDTVHAIIKVLDLFTRDREKEAQAIYGTNDNAHPGVKRLKSESDLLLSGYIEVAKKPDSAYVTLTPAQTRELFKEQQWQTIVGFQTRNPIHRAHEYLHRCVLELFDALLLHPLMGETKADDIPRETRWKTYETLLNEYYPSKRVILSAFPASMRYAGPREAIFHALVRKNYGCTHFIIGRDHAGVANYYGPYDAQEAVKSLAPRELGITPLYFDNAFYCTKCEAMATKKTCPHSEEYHLNLSGTQVRKLLQEGRFPPAELTRKEIADILAHELV